MGTEACDSHKLLCLSNEIKSYFTTKIYATALYYTPISARIYLWFSIHSYTQWYLKQYEVSKLEIALLEPLKGLFVFVSFFFTIYIQYIKYKDRFISYMLDLK